MSIDLHHRMDSTKQNLAPIANNLTQIGQKTPSLPHEYWFPPLDTRLRYPPAMLCTLPDPYPSKPLLATLPLEMMPVLMRGAPPIPVEAPPA